MKFDHAKMSEILLTVEKKFDVNNIKLDNCHLWPMIRVMMYFQMLNYQVAPPSTEQKSSKAQRHPFGRISSLLKFLKDFLIHLTYQMLRPLRREESSSAIFITRNEDKKFLFSTESTNPFFYSIKKLFPKSAILELNAEELYSKRTQIIGPFKIRRITRAALSLDDKFRQISQFTNKEFSDFSFGHASYIWFLYEILIYRAIYQSIFASEYVNTVFTTVFYSSSSMAAAWAANDMGIDVVEIQHGQQGNINPINNNWTKLPETGYLLMPRFFWVWGKLTKERKKGFEDHPFHKIVIGGNPNLSLSSQQVRAKLRRKGQIHVLFAMQPIKDPFPDFLLDLIQKTPESDIFWHLRLHPRMLDRLEEIEELFQHMPNVEVKNSSGTPLYLLLPQIDRTLTLWSTVVYESCFFRIPSCVLSPNGKNLMKEHIESALLNYADDIESLKSFIFSPENKNFEVLSNFIETDQIQIKHNIETALPQLKYQTRQTSTL